MLSRVGEVAYKLALPATSLVHPVFHVSQLRRAYGVAHSSPLLPPQLSPDLELLVEPAELLGVRRHCQDAHKSLEVLIKWKDLPLFEATWENYDYLLQQFPEFHLEDKVKFWRRVMIDHQFDTPMQEDLEIIKKIWWDIGSYDQ